MAAMEMGSTDHVVKTGRTELSHHSLRERVVRRLEKPKNNIVCPDNNIKIREEKRRVLTNQNSQTLWNLSTP
jgi:hypothetical protein